MQARIILIEELPAKLSGGTQASDWLGPIPPRLWKRNNRSKLASIVTRTTRRSLLALLADCQTQRLARWR